MSQKQSKRERERVGGKLGEWERERVRDLPNKK